MRTSACRGLVSAGILLATAGAASAQTELIFSEYSYQNAKIKAIRLDGTNLRELYSLPAADWLPLGLAVNPANGRLYWSDSVFEGIDVMTAGLSGSPAPTSVATVTDSPTSRGASLDALGRIYFTAGNTVRRVDADGANLTTLHTSLTDTTNGAPVVDATNGHVYFDADGQIKRMNLDGADVKTVVRGVANPRAIQLDVANRHIYWVDAQTNTDHVARANLDGTDFRVLWEYSPGVDASSPLSDLLLEPVGGKLYVAVEYGPGEIRRFNLNGSGPEIFYSSPSDQFSPSGLALSTGAPVQPVSDCDNDGLSDAAEIAGGAPDCNNNGVPDSCETNPCIAAFLLDTESFGSGGRTVGDPQAAQQYQPFDVPAGGWTVGTLGVDGWTTSYSPVGMNIKLFPDDGTLTAPNEAVAPLASVDTFTGLRFDPFHNEVWVYTPFSVTLPEGRYWLRFQSNDPAAYRAAIRTGINGEASRYRFVGGTGNLLTHTLPLAVRLVEAPACRADFNGSGAVDVADIFAFLSAWFSNAPGSDFNGSGAVDVADIFAFLSAWFAGCA